MKAKPIFFAAIALCGIGFACSHLLLKGKFQQTKAATFTASGTDWLDDIARYDNRQMWLALRSSDFKMILEETRGLPYERTIQQTLQYQADPKSPEVIALKSLFKERFCSGFLASELRENGLTKTLLFTDKTGQVLNTATLSEENCAAYR